MYNDEYWTKQRSGTCVVDWFGRTGKHGAERKPFHISYVYLIQFAFNVFYSLSVGLLIFFLFFFLCFSSFVFCSCFVFDTNELFACVYLSTCLCFLYWKKKDLIQQTTKTHFVYYSFFSLRLAHRRFLLHFEMVQILPNGSAWCILYGCYHR